MNIVPSLLFESVSYDEYYFYAVWMPGTIQSSCTKSGNFQQFFLLPGGSTHFIRSDASYTMSSNKANKASMVKEHGIKKHPTTY